MPRFFRKPEKKKIKITMPLQVRIPENERKSGTFLNASLTVEAAFALPLLLFTAWILLMPFRVMDLQRQVQAAVEACTDRLGEEAALLWTEEREEMTEAAAWILAEAQLREKTGDLPIEGLSLVGSVLMQQGGELQLRASYRVRLPFSVLGNRSLSCESASFGRAWIGKPGLYLGLTGEEEGEEDIIWVYVGQNSTRYHKDRNCHYLFHNLRMVSFSKIEEYRNQSGGRYTPCSRCGRSVGDVVYILPSGDHYHGDKDCSSLMAYVRQVPLAEVIYLGPCSYCSRE